MRWPWAKVEQQRAIGHEDFFGRPMSGPARITHDSAASLAPVFSAVRLISETVASLPVYVVQAKADGTRDRVDHAVNNLLDNPNPLQSRFEFLETAISAQELRGNAYIELSLEGGRVTALWPMPANIVRPERVGAGIIFHVSTKNGVVDVGPDRIMHWKFCTLSKDGVEGSDPVALLAADLGAARAARDHAAKYFENAATPSGVLTHPETVGMEAAERLRKQFAERNVGKGAHKPLLLEEGMTYSPISPTPEASQLLATRQYSISDVARIWRIPPHMLADLSRSNFSNAESEMQSFATHSLRPRVCRLEQALDRALLTPFERASGLGIRFNLDSLLRGNLKDRYAAHAQGIGAGFLTRNEARKLEDMPPINGLDEIVLMPGATTPGTDNNNSGTATSGANGV